MKIGIDARFYGPNFGIGRYTQNLIVNLAKIDRENQYIIFGANQAQKDVADFPNFRFVKLTARPYSIAEQTTNPRLLSQAKLDLLHVPHFNAPIFYPGRLVITIHDLIKHQSKGSRTTTRSPAIYRLKYLAYRINFSFSVRKAESIITPSQWSKNQLIEKYPQAKGKTFVVYEGVDPTIRKISDKNLFKKVSKKYSLHRPFLLFVGSLYPHKNINAILKAVQMLDRAGEGITLVIVSGRDIFLQRTKQKINELGIEKRVKILNKISNKKLSILYSNALALVFPSFLEGFGLPGLEAMSCGCPVIASNSSCLPEVYGGAAEYFDPCRVDQIVDKIRRLAEKKEERKKLVSKGEEHWKKFSWRKNALETLKIYQKCLKTKK